MLSSGIEKNNSPFFILRKALVTLYNPGHYFNSFYIRTLIDFTIQAITYNSHQFINIISLCLWPITQSEYLISPRYHTFPMLVNINLEIKKGKKYFYWHNSVKKFYCIWIMFFLFGGRRAWGLTSCNVFGNSLKK